MTKTSDSPKETQKNSESDTKQQFKIAIHKANTLELRDTSDTIGNGSGLFSSKNVAEISNYTV